MCWVGHAAAEEPEALVGAIRDVGARYGDRVSLGWATVGLTMRSAVAVSSDFESYYEHVLGRQKDGRASRRDDRARAMPSDPGGLP